MASSQATEAASQKPESSQWGTTPWRYLLISLYWFPVSLFWGMMLAQILPTRVEDYASTLQKGSYLATISVLGALGAAVIQLVIGPISDHCRAKWGRRRPFLLVGTLGGVAAMVGFCLAHSFVGLVISFFLIQLFINIANGPYQAFIPDHVPPHNQGRASAFMGLMQLLGEAGGPFIAGTVLDNAVKSHVGAVAKRAAEIAATQHLLLADALLLIVFMLISVLFVPDEPSTDTGSIGMALKSLADLKVRENPGFYWLLLSRMVFNLGFYVALAFLAYYVQDSLKFGEGYHDPLRNIQLIAIASALAGTFPAGYLADRISKKRLVYASGVFTFASTIAFALATHVGFAYAMTVFFGLGYGIFRAVDWAFACNLLPKGGAARYMAIWSLSATLPQVLAPAFGPVADHINKAMGLGAGWRAAMMVSAVAGLAGILLISKVIEPAANQADSYEPSPAGVPVGISNEASTQESE